MIIPVHSALYFMSPHVYIAEMSEKRTRLACLEDDVRGDLSAERGNKRALGQLVKALIAAFQPISRSGLAKTINPMVKRRACWASPFRRTLTEFHYYLVQHHNNSVNHPRVITICSFATVYFSVCRHNMLRADGKKIDFTGYFLQS